MPGASDAAVERLYQEAKDHFTTLVQGIHALMDNTASLIRIQVLVMGIVATGLPFLFTSDGTAPPGTLLVVSAFGAGFVALVASTVAAVQSYLRPEISMGLDAREIATVLNREVEEQDILKGALHAYRQGIEENGLVLEAASSRSELSLRFLLVALVLLGMGALGLLVLGAH